MPDDGENCSCLKYAGETMTCWQKDTGRNQKTPRGTDGRCWYQPALFQVKEMTRPSLVSGKMDQQQLWGGSNGVQQPPHLTLPEVFSLPANCAGMLDGPFLGSSVLPSCEQVEVLLHLCLRLPSHSRFPLSSAAVVTSTPHHSSYCAACSTSIACSGGSCFPLILTPH